MSSKSGGDGIDMLKKIFEMQADLNDYVFARNKLNDQDGNTLDMDAIYSAVNKGKLKVNELPNTWLSR